MNERIRELHSQCKVCDKDTVLYFDYERFAKLIVRECAGLCSDPVVVLQHWGLDSESE